MRTNAEALTLAVESQGFTSAPGRSARFRIWAITCRAWRVFVCVGAWVGVGVGGGQWGRDGNGAEGL